MNRREAVQYISILLGGTMVGANALISGCTSDDKKDTAGKQVEFSKDQIAYLDEVAETILPTTASSPGAKAAGVGAFMTVMVRDCYEAKDQQLFLDGLDKLEEQAENRFKTGFMAMTPQQRTQLLIELDKEQKQYMSTKKPEDPSHYFRMMKELTMFGYFTSEIGMTKARRYAPVPGRYEGCVPYTKGEKAWA